MPGSATETQRAISLLKAQGRSVEKADFPPGPLPALYIVDGAELTEAQLVSLAMRSF